MHLASPALWKKSEVLIPWLFLGRWCVVERKHWNPEATVAAVGLAGMAGLGHGVLSCVGCAEVGYRNINPRVWTVFPRDSAMWEWSAG